VDKDIRFGVAGTSTLVLFKAGLVCATGDTLAAAEAAAAV
jgi:hypothetical protein